jgi:DNA-directed RNA polymerase specialized sigma24 family protein
MVEQAEEGYELFRRAILERDTAAWTEIYVRYRALLIFWAARCNARMSSPESPGDIADQALARAWAALTPERFANFRSLSQLLAYLRTCVVTTAIDSARTQAHSEHTALPPHIAISETPEEIVLANMEREALWRKVLSLTATPAERVVLVESFLNSVPPRIIWARHPQLFPDVTAVYTTKRNLFERLQRNRDLLQLYEHLSVA